METSQANPITQRLTRGIDPKRQRVQVVAVVTLAVIVGVIGSSWTVGVFLIATPGMPSLAGAYIITMVMAALPVITGVASSILTYHETHDENFKLIQITPLADREIIDGLVKGIKHLLRPILRASDGLAFTIGATPFFVYLLPLFIDWWGFSVSTISSSLVGKFVSANIITQLAVAYFWATTRMTHEMAVLAGVYGAMRFRDTNIALISVGVACGVLLTQSLVSPLTAFLTVVSLYTTSWAHYTLLLGTLIYFCVPIVGSKVISTITLNYMKRTRLSAG